MKTQSKRIRESSVDGRNPQRPAQEHWPHQHNKLRHQRPDRKVQTRRTPRFSTRIFNETFQIKLPKRIPISDSKSSQRLSEGLKRMGSDWDWFLWLFHDASKDENSTNKSTFFPVYLFITKIGRFKSKELLPRRVERGIRNRRQRLRRPGRSCSQQSTMRRWHELQRHFSCQRGIATSSSLWPDGRRKLPSENRNFWRHRSHARFQIREQRDLQKKGEKWCWQYQ